MREIKYAELDRKRKAVLNAAKEAMRTAYNPYSGFYVGAALWARSGQIITGSNVENAVYGFTICAERSAIVRANAMGLRDFSMIAIVTRGENFDTHEPTFPCGGCRQMLSELADLTQRPMEIVLATTNLDKIAVTTIDELLPHAVGPRMLGVDITKYQT